MIVNVGGEGEVPGALNVNSFVFLTRPIEAIRASGPVVQADFRRIPLRDGVAEEVVGNRLPRMDVEDRRALALEAFRILRSRGGVRLWETSAKGIALVPALAGAGFIDARLVSGVAVGHKP